MNNREKLDKFEKVIKESKIMDFLKENYNPHATIIITSNYAKIVSDEMEVYLDEH